MKDASRVFLCNSGTEANEAALKFARKYGKSINPEKYEFITLKILSMVDQWGIISDTKSKISRTIFSFDPRGQNC